MEDFWNSDRTQSLIGAAVLVIVSMLSVYLLSQGGPWSAELSLIAGLFLVNIVCFFLSTSDWAQQQRHRMMVVIWLEAAIIVSLYFLVSISFVAILGIIWVVQITELFPIRTTSWILLAAVSIFSFTQIFHWNDSSLMLALTGSITLSLFHLFAVIATYRAKREQELREETAALNRELLATRELLTEHSRQTERLRIARDLHDLLGHHLTAQILQLEVATHVTDGTGRQKVEQALALGKLLLSDLRTAVSELREDEPINFRDAVKKLVIGVPNIDIHLNFNSTLGEMHQAETLLRCTREALTNILRHSGASRCDISFNSTDSHYHLQIRDDGRCRDSVTPGNGLKGIKERVEEAGGDVRWYADSGFVIDIYLPLESELAEAS
ncbi:sensor histidine kinase [Pseudohongiella sp. O18]|uniref:sensor histidine kinase n=1 Tax=Pseudohongiella sp. O18 TaxID=2904248 RepID=UPI000C3B9492|nr:histidine kinase [Pseudohongiella sp. O18]MAY55871.1 hypothetical protein [Gammaproteobacteria bacterium]MBJ54584.1 hypothetical protein [Gammaproteobacteria bacterium]HBN15406.1 hypothetical protein [Pseudohongiella sp.]